LEDIEMELVSKANQGPYVQIVSLLRNKRAGEELPVVFLHPKDWNERVVIWPHDDGKDGLFDENGAPTAGVSKLIARGATVVGVDLLYQGEFLADEDAPTEGRRVDNPRQFAGYTWGYNSTLFAHRVGDLLTVISFCQTHGDTRPRVELLALGNAGAWAAAARAQAQGAVARAAIDTGGFRFAKMRSIGDLNFLPGGAKYGDLPGMLALAAPGALWLAGEGADAPELVQAAYEAAGARDRLESYAGTDEGKAAAAIQWLAQP
jgi:hypothetical protein